MAAYGLQASLLPLMAVLGLQLLPLIMAGYVFSLFHFISFLVIVIFAFLLDYFLVKKELLLFVIAFLCSLFVISSWVWV